MPQASNKRQDTRRVSLGQGSTYSTLTDLALDSRRRANKLNQIENQKLGVLTELLTRQAHLLQSCQERRIARVTSGLRDIAAHKALIRQRIANAIKPCPEPGPDPSPDPSSGPSSHPSSHHNYNLSSPRPKYNTGADPSKKTKENVPEAASSTDIYLLSTKDFRRELQRKRRELKPEVRRAKAQRHHLETLKAENKVVLFDRKRSLTLLLEDYKANKLSTTKNEHIPKCVYPSPHNATVTDLCPLPGKSVEDHQIHTLTPNDEK